MPTTTATPQHTCQPGGKRRLRALVEAVGHDLVFWCPNCAGQIARVKGQVALPTLALVEVKHINECKGRVKS